MLQVREVDLSCLKPWEGNPRLNDCSIDAVAKSINTFGFNVPILCNGDFTIVAGHTRWKAAKKLGLSTVPVIVLALTDSQRRAFAVADNKTAEIAEWDFPKLREILDNLSGEDVELKSLGFSEEELRRLMGPEEEDLPPTVQGEPETKPGDVWILGEHRLMCGNSADKGTSERLLNGRGIHLVFAGPPCFNQKAFAHWEQYDAYLQDMRRVIANCCDVMKDGGIVVWNVGNGSADHRDHTGHHSIMLEEAGLKYLDTIAWVKNGGNFGVPRNCHIQHHGLYYPAFQWEALLVFQKPGDMPRMTREGRDYMSAYQTNVWEIAAVRRQMETYGHPAVCPLEIPYRCMQAYSRRGDYVFDPFSGSGTTLVGADKAGRLAFGIEMSPSFCDGAVRRWESLTGHKARKESA